MSDTKKIEDFGEKIGGARKELWKSRNLELSDVTDWTAIERERYITKKQVWKAPDYQKLCDEGLSRRLVFFIKLIHDNLPAVPQKNTQEYQDGYIEFVSDVRDRAMRLKTDNDIDGFLTSIIDDYYLNGMNSYGCLTSKFMRTPDKNYQLDRKIREKQFLYTDEEKALSKYAFFEYNGNNIDFDKTVLILKRDYNKYYFYRNEEKFLDKNNWKAHSYCIIGANNHIVENNFETLEAAKRFAVEYEKSRAENQKNTEKKSRKKRFIPQQLAHIKRIGEDYRSSKNISGEDMLNTFGFHGGEFGNWENQNERQQNLNFSYEAFKDLARAIGVNDSDISLDGKLSIAYGARGIGNALAHFEPERNVINLTKMKGAGSLAHEWGHALDFFLASKLNLNFHYATESCHELIKPVLLAIKWKPENGTFIKTDYYKNSAKMDKLYSKSDKGYWSSETEMFARAFACYIADRLSPEKSDYLCGHSETAIGMDSDGNPICAFPQDEERKAINYAFDELIKMLKEREIMHENKMEKDTENMAAEIEKKNEKRRENLLKIAEKIGYKRAMERLEQGLYTSNLPSQEIDFRKNIIAEIQQKAEIINDIPQRKDQTENIKKQPQKNHIHKSDEEIEQANYVNLPQFLMSHGFELKPVGKEYIMKDHDSVHITDNALGEKGKWFRFSQNRGGDNIAFVQEFMGKSFHEAVELLNGGRSAVHQQKAPIQEQKNYAEQEIHIQKNSDAKRALAYLSKTRGLDYEMVKNLAFRGDLVQEAKTGNAVFLVKNERGTIVGAEKVGTSSDRKFKSIAAGSSADHGFEMCYGKGENMLFFESTIDMLSYAQLHKNNLDNHRLISMMGVKPSVVETAMKRYNIPPERIYICSDNDTAGNNFAKKFQEKYPEIKRLTAEPQYKDWNDQLRNIPMENYAENKLKTFGNSYWNKAVGNSEKIIFQMKEDTFLQCKNALDNAAVNYFAFTKNGTVDMAVLENEADIFRNLIGRENAEKIRMRKAEREYAPPEKNIVGNTDIQDIMLKSEIEAETQIVLKIAELLSRENIKFSAEIRENTSTLSVASEDVEKVESLEKSVAENRRQYFPEDVGQNKEILGNASYDPETKKPDISDCYYFISRLNPQEYKDIQPILESSEKARFSAVMRDEKIIFVVEKAQAQDFVHEYNRAKNQNKIQKSLSGMGLDEEQIKAYDTSIEKAAELGLIGILDDYASKDYSSVQTAEINALLTAYLSDRSNENFTALLDGKSRMDKEILNETYHENASKVPTEEEVLFTQADLARFLAERTLSSDEWEDMAYPLFEKGYIDRVKSHDNFSFGGGLSEHDFYGMARRYHNGDDIRRELALGLLEGGKSSDMEFVFEDGKISDRTFYYAENLHHRLHTEKTENGYKCSFSGMERFVSFEEIGQAFIDRTHEEFDDLMYWRILDYIKDNIPDIADETVQQLIKAFDGAALPDWEKGDNQPKINRIKKALFDILGDEVQTEKAFACIAKHKYNVSFEPEKPESSIHFGLLGNGITAYDVSRTDKETNDYPTVAHISPEGVIKIYDDSLSAEDIKRINEQAQSAREKFMTDWNMLSTEQQFQKLLDRADVSTTVNINRDKLSMEQKVEKYMPFVFFGEGERPEPQTEEQLNGTYKIYQLPDGEKYHGIRFEGKKQLEKEGVQINYEDYNLVYDGKIDDFKGNAALEALYTQFNTALPADFKGHSLSVSDVIVISVDGNDTAYYCDSIGFVEMPEFFKEKEIVQKIEPKEQKNTEKSKKLYDVFIYDEESKTNEPVRCQADNEREARDIGNTYIRQWNLLNAEITDIQEVQPEIEKIVTKEETSVEDDKPSQNTSHEQISMLDNSSSVPKQEIRSESKAKQSSQLFVGDVNTMSALYDEIKRGSGVLNGKIRIQKFYEENKPNMIEFADFLKREYGTGGHSADDPIAFVNHDSKGIKFTLSDENGGFSDEGFSFKWSDVAVHTAETIDRGEYFTEKEREIYAGIISEKSEKNTVEIAENTPETTPFETISESDYTKENLPKNITESPEKSTEKEKSFAQQVDESLNGTLSPYTTIKICDTPQILLNIGCEQLPMLYTQRHLKNAVKPLDEKEHQHGLSVDQIKKLPQLLEAPVMVFDSISKKDSLVVVTSEFDANDNPVVVSVKPNGKGRYEVEEINSNFVTSVYGRNNFIDFFQRTLAQDSILYLSKNKSQEMFERWGEQYSELTNNLSSDVIIHQSRNIVNTSKQKNNDYTITDNTLGEGGAKTRFKGNITAIETLKTLEKEERPATNEEKEILSKYVGWGGLAQAFDSGNEKWAKEFSQLKTLLSDSEYRSAKASVLDSFYTPPIVIDSIYNAVEKFGFSGGNVLEPSCGVGNFIGKMPEEMRQNSSVYGVEIDSISGRIAKHIYPEADIQVKGFEKTDFQNGCFDIAVGNVPFGDLGFIDKEYNTKQLHDFFFAKTLDELKNGGIAAFLTSTGTLDKVDETIRKMLSEKADLIGAIRLPSGTFMKNAGTEVDSDIIFLQKRSDPPEHEPDWVHIGQTEDGLPINKYFEQNPDMILGKMTEGNKLYGHGTICMPIEGADFKEQLENAVQKLSATISDERAADVYPKVAGMTVIPPENLRNFSFFEQDNTIYFKTSDRICEARCNHTNKDFQAVKAFIELRDTTRELLSAQEQNRSDFEIKALQEKLNLQYDSFTKKFGLLHSKTNKNRFADDVSYNLTAALEKSFDLSRGIAEKADIFTKRTIKPPQAVDHADTAMEALTISLSEKACVDLDYMQTLTDTPKDKLILQLQGEIFPIPFAGKDEFQTAAEYLSGNIYQKLEIAENAAKTDIRFENNVRALKESLPPPLKAEDIEIQLGAAWIEPKVYQQFMYELLETADEKRADKLAQTIDECMEQLKSESIYKRFQIQREVKKAESALKNAVTIARSSVSGEWSITPKPIVYSNLTVHEQEYSTKRRSAYQIMEDLLNLREPKVYKTVVEYTPDGEKERRVLDDKATKAAHLKAEKIKSEFKDWLFKDPQRRNELVQQYNEKFNCIKPREYDGSNLTFPTMNADIELRPHQKNAVAHAMFGGNTLFAHAVGAGKTFEMIATAMESKRLGLCNKPMLCVPKQLTEQIGEDFRLLYPNANILVATSKDFEKNNRQQLFAKIAAGDFDAVIVSHEQLGKIPISKERQVNLLEDQLNDIVRGIAEAKQREGSSVQVKALERSRKSVKKRLDTLLEKPQDNTVTFEEMGIDKLIVDEAHNFKNLFTPTRLQNVSGISSSASQKAEDLFMKCRYLDEKTGGKGVTFATGTPLSNSMTELHVMMRYLEYDFLKEMGLESFDNWISIFGKQQTDWQLNTTGSDVKQKVHMSYTGIPELMSMFKQIADIRMADMLNLDVPECEMHVVQTEPTEEQKDMLAELSSRADALQNRVVTDPRIDNPLKITGDGRKLALDPRLIDPTLEDNPNTKLNKCVENVFKIYEETASDKLTQIIFCDLGVPSGAAKKESAKEEKSIAEQESLEEICNFCVYDDIRKKLIEKGVKPDEIVYIHNAKTEKDKENLFAKVRSGEVRVLLGSTSKMGTGVNVQKKLIAVHDLDIPWRPADMEQRRGRLVRQGNENKNVHQYRYVTKGTFDSYSYQLLESKQNFISQIMTSNAITRNADDVDQQALNYSEIKALCIGDERLKQRADMENEVANMRIQKREHDSRIYDMQDLIAQYPETKSRLENTLEALRIDKAHVDKLPIDPENNRPIFGITINGKKYSEKKSAAAALMNSVMSQIDAKSEAKSIEIGEFMGFPLTVEINDKVNLGGEKSAFLTATLHGAAKYNCDFTESFDTNLRRLESTVSKIDKRIENTENTLNGLEIDHENAQKIVNEPFELKSRDGRSLSEMETALKELTEELAKSAANAKRNAPDKPQTHYFSLAALKKSAAQIKNQERKPQQNKSKSNELE